MTAKTETPKFSNEISSICRLFESAQRDYAWNSEKIVEMDRLTQDFLHVLELGDKKYEERAKIATALQRCRKERRQHKDTVLILEPIVQFLETEKGRQMMNLLKEALGKTRKAEEKMAGRVYCPRILEMEEIK